MKGLFLNMYDDCLALSTMAGLILMWNLHCDGVQIRYCMYVHDIQLGIYELM